MTEEQRTEITQTLQRPFLPNEIGKLPRGGIVLDYVGHADVTRRLLEADPDWNWEPKAKDVDPEVMAAALATGNADIIRQVLDNAPPKFDLGHNGAPVGLWIRLTVGGVTRLGYGSVPDKQNDAVKVLIGDALRNAAMRFGVALGLWAKGDRADPTAENPSGSAGQVRRGRPAEAFENAAPAKPRTAAKAARTVKAPADAETDIDWMGHLVDDLIPAASTRGELLGFWDNIAEKVAEGKCTEEHAKQIGAMITERAEMIGAAEKSAAA